MNSSGAVLSKGYQSKWANKQFFDESILENIDPEVVLHKDHISPVSSEAACINVLGNLGKTENTHDFSNVSKPFRAKRGRSDPISCRS